MARTVTKIPQTRNLFTTAPIATTARRKVAGYARVSTDSDEQFTSYEAQVDYYTQFIRSHADWDFVKVYTDEGISAVTTRHRDGFNEMIADALAGKNDLIVTKSVSRFARNTVDSLTTIRKLKEHGCECFFEKENIYTFDGKGELLITIMSSLAQEESRSISENVTWGHRKRMADGKVSVPYSVFLGYDKGEDGNLVVNEKEARIVRLIYRKFMEGMAPIGICRMLDEMGILTPSGKTHWRESTILSILKNEKYKGDALLQKTFTVDFLTKKHKRNEGEVQQYYVSGNHEAIIPPDEFEQVQAELARRKRSGRTFSGNSVFASRLICGDCGGYYGQKVWHSNDPYRKVIWRCNRKYGKGQRCSTPTLSEDAIKALFVKAYNLLLGNRETIIEDAETLVAMLEDTAALDTKIAAAQEEIDTVVEMNKALIREHAAIGMEQAAFNRKRHHNTAVHLIWNKEDILKVQAAVMDPEKRVDFMDMVGDYDFKNNCSTIHMDAVYDGEKLIGASSDRMLSAKTREMISICTIDEDYAVEGKAVEVLWGNPGTCQMRIRAKVTLFPYIKEDRNDNIDIEKIPHPVFE